MCKYKIVKNINENDSGDVTPANGADKIKYAHK